jgi:hypothetical protein
LAASTAPWCGRSTVTSRSGRNQLPEAPPEEPPDPKISTREDRLVLLGVQTLARLLRGNNGCLSQGF